MSTMVGPGALNTVGLIVWYADWESQTTSDPALHCTRSGCSWLYYLPDVDNDNKHILRIKQLDYEPARVPTMERALVDYLRHLDIFDLEYMWEGLEEYMRLTQDLTPLRTVATEYGVLGKLNALIQEIEDENVS